MIDALSSIFSIAVCESIKANYYSCFPHIACEDIESEFGWIESSKKEYVKLFSPIILKENCEGIESSRKDSSVAFVTAMVLDFDNDDMELDKIKEALEPNGYYGHTTWSHSEAHHKYRIIVPMDKPVEASAWKGVWKAFIDERSLPVDKKCCNPSRVYYFPSHRPGITPSEYFSFKKEGVAIDTDLYKEIAMRSTPDPIVFKKISIKMREPKNNIDWGTFDARLFLESNGWQYEEHEGKFWTFCPWRHSHSDPSKDSINDAFFGTAPNGRAMFHCSHAHCDRRWLGDIMKEFGGEDFCDQPKGE